MAFRQPTYHAPSRIYTSPQNQKHQSPTQTAASPPIEESQEWILFSPIAPSATDRTYTDSTDRTRTAGRSRISDVGSLDTPTRSYGYDESSEHAEATAEDDELDSLDSHLHEFRTEPSVYRGEREGEASGPVLPTHDGLGSFRVDAGGELDVQRHLYAFERFNPRRVSSKRRRESEDLALYEVENERAVEVERARRIESWRLEQSRLLVDEIQRETRRRKASMSSFHSTSISEREQEDVATLSNVDGEVAGQREEPEENESFWNRITRRVIRDLMGIDDDLLSIIFGEALPEDDDLSTTPPANSPLDAAKSIIATNQYDQASWEYRLLERIARELGILVNQISDHPGAFSTYLQSTQTPLPYAGLSVIPETGRDVSAPPFPQNNEQSTLTSQSPNPEFQPTLQTQPLTIPQSTTSLAPPSPFEDADATLRPSNILTREEWERDLDIKMVFRYLRSRFSSFSSRPTPILAGIGNFSTSHLATASTADTAARAARVRQHHPLVTSSHTKTRARTWRASVPETKAMLRRGSSSCASELSGRGILAGRQKNSIGSGSRHYWDFGPGSVGSGGAGGGSMIASTGGMGSWGEV